MITPGRTLAAAMAASAALILWMGHGAGFSGDEIIFVVSSPHLDLGTVLDPHGGHLLALTRLVYKPMLEVFGLDYLPFRVLTVLTILLCVWLLFVWARRRVDPWLALLPCLVLLVFGADPLHTFQGNGFTVMLSVALGIAALLAVERGDLKGDLSCCGFLILGVMAYSVSIPFVFGVALLLAWKREWRRAWIVLVPLALYALWRLTADFSGDSGGLDLANLLLVPSWAFQAICEYLAALPGLGYDFTGTAGVSQDPVGPALAVLALAALAFGVHRRGVGPTLAAVGLIGLVLWAMQAVAAGDATGLRLPGDPRYQYPGAFVILLIAFAAVGPARPSRRTMAILAVATGAAVAVNVMALRDGADYVRGTSDQGQAMAGALKLAGAVTDADQTPDLSSSVGALSAMAGSPYGTYGYDYERLRELPEPERQNLDLLISKLGRIRIEPVAAGVSCHPAPEVTVGSVTVVRSPRGGALSAGLLADAETVQLGVLEPGRPTMVTLSGAGGHEWRLAVAGGDLEICG